MDGKSWIYEMCEWKICSINLNKNVSFAKHAQNMLEVVKYSHYENICQNDENH